MLGYSQGRPVFEHTREFERTIALFCHRCRALALLGKPNPDPKSALKETDAAVGLAACPEESANAGHTRITALCELGDLGASRGQLVQGPF
jgi:hypothetical protein